MTHLGVILNWPYEMTPWTFWASLWNSDVRLDPGVTLFRAVCPTPVLGGNMAVKTALEAGCDELLFLDMDQDVPVDVLARFRAHDKDIVGALTALRPYPHVWSMFNFSPTPGRRVNIKPAEPLQRVDVTGNGCMLVKRRVFDGIKPPWFGNIVSEDGCTLEESSDFYFFRKVKDAGFELYIDTTLESPHRTELTLHSHSLQRQQMLIEIYEKAGLCEPAPAAPDKDLVVIAQEAACVPA